MQSLKNIIKDKDAFVKSLTQRHKYVSQEFQDYGYRIALQLGEKERVSLFIKIAKTKPRALVESAFRFAIDYPSAKSKGRLFMWKLKKLESGEDTSFVPDDVVNNT